MHRGLVWWLPTGCHRRCFCTRSLQNCLQVVMWAHLPAPVAKGGERFSGMAVLPFRAELVSSLHTVASQPETRVPALLALAGSQICLCTLLALPMEVYANFCLEERCNITQTLNSTSSPISLKASKIGPITTSISTSISQRLIKSNSRPQSPRTSCTCKTRCAHRQRFLDQLYLPPRRYLSH